MEIDIHCVADEGYFWSSLQSLVRIGERATISISTMQGNIHVDACDVMVQLH